MLSSGCACTGVTVACFASKGENDEKINHFQAFASPLPRRYDGDVDVNANVNENVNENERTAESKRDYRGIT